MEDEGIELSGSMEEMINKIVDRKVLGRTSQPSGSMEEIINKIFYRKRFNPASRNTTKAEMIICYALWKFQVSRHKVTMNEHMLILNEINKSVSEFQFALGTNSMALVVPDWPQALHGNSPVRLWLYGTSAAPPVRHWALENVKLFHGNSGKIKNLNLETGVKLPIYHEMMPAANQRKQIRELKNYHINSNLYKLYKNSEITDVHFIFNDEKKKISAHKCLLAVASPVFERMFYGQLKELGDITIVDATHDAFLEFLQFFYCDKFELSIEHISEVLTLADKYDVAGLINLCVQFLEYNLSDESVCWVYDLALMFDLNHLINMCQEKICLETVAVFTSQSFKMCGLNILSRILTIDELSCDEIFVYNQVMEWASEACRRSNLEPTMENKKNELGQCFDLIRFPTMTSEQFSNCISEDGLLNSSELIDILGYLTLRRTLKTKRFSIKPRCGIPAWTKDHSIKTCDRRSLPNLIKLVVKNRDVTVFSVNERILLGQLSFSSFKSESNDRKQGQLIIRRSNRRDLLLLSQIIEISSSGISKIILQKPIILQPFEEYEIETKWELDNRESLLFRTSCRNEIMLDGGVRFQFQPDANLDYDNVSEGLLVRLYFKMW